MAEMAEMDSVVDFLYQHMRAHLKDKDLMRVVKTYRGHIPMYHHLSQISQGLYDALRDKKEVGDVWREAAKIALWSARIADLYEKEADRTASSVSPS